MNNKIQGNQDQMKQNEHLNEFKFRTSAQRNFSPLHISDSNAPSAARFRDRTQNLGFNRLFGTINSLQDFNDKQSNSSLSLINNHDYYYKHLNDNLSEHLLTDSHQLRQKKATLEKDNALLLQKTDHQNQEIEMLKDKIKAMQAEQGQLIKVIQSYDGSPRCSTERKYFEEQKREQLVEMYQLRQDNCELQHEIQMLKRKEQTLKDKISQLEAEHQHLNMKHVQELQ